MADGLVALLTAGIVLDHAHLVSPIALAWSNAAARERMLARWWKFILFPLSLVALAAWVGLAANNTRAPVFGLLALVYFWWNLIHFGMQNYGVCRMLGYRKPRQTDVVMIATILPAVWIPALGTTALLVAGLAVSFAHWITDLVLCARASRRRLVFGCAMLAAGFLGFVWKTTELCDSPLGVCGMVYSIPWLLALRFGLGFVHFLYSRWVWQRGSELLDARL